MSSVSANFALSEKPITRRLVRGGGLSRAPTPATSPRRRIRRLVYKRNRGALCQITNKHNRLKMNDKETREAFVRIAMARIKADYPFYPQRIAIAASMYRRWLDKKSETK
jgi:hypothetical protein